jgi:hypothetical protein
MSGVMLVCAVAGCGRGGARVSGTVTLDGRPLDTGSVQFHPAAAGPVAYGSIDAQGRFTLRVGAAASPVAPGRYTATVVAVAATAPTSPDAETLPVPITPQKYGDVATSGLTFDLKPGENTIDIDLVSSRDGTGPP